MLISPRRAVIGLSAAFRRAYPLSRPLSVSVKGTRTSNRAAVDVSDGPITYPAITAGVLILLDLPLPSNYRSEGDRVLWALCGVGIGVLVMLLGGLLAKLTAKAPPRPASPVCRAPRGMICTSTHSNHSSKTTIW